MYNLKIVIKMCLIEGCKTRPIYNKEGEKKGLYCSAHKLEGMVNVTSQICLHEGCKTQPNYNKEGRKKGLYCSAHKLEGMVDVKHQTCLHEGCKKIPNYNKEGEFKALYCSAHKLERMVNVKNKTCIHEGCKTQPIYNKEGESKALYCSTHKLEAMVDVKNKTCLNEACKKKPNYNKEGESKALYCSAHKLEGMVNVNAKTCLHEYCKTLPTYNKEGETKVLYCSAHKLEGMVDVKNKTCKSEWCRTRVKGKYDGYCLHCYMHLFPEKPVSRNYKTKECAVVEFVRSTFPNQTWIADKHIQNGCSKRRPDLLLDLGYQVLILEIDENQHMDYDCSCENKRLMELSQDIGHRPLVFLRFNPDDYMENGKQVFSCWGQNNKGICVVKKSKQNEWKQRLNVLETQIIYWIQPNNATNKTIEIIQLFYDI